MKCVTVVLAVLGPALLSLSADATEGFVTRQGSTLYLDGREYRAIGVNMPDLHQTYAGTWFHIPQIFGTPEKARQAIVAGIEDAGQSEMAFIRFFASPGYPRDQAMLYDQNPARYWMLMDELFGLCRQHRLKLVPSLGTIPGPYLHLGEKGRAILDPQSRTSNWVRQYIREFVTRYKDDPTVLMWELVNEGMLNADVEMEGRKLLPAGVYPPGTTGVRETGSADDSLNWADYLLLYRDHTAFIKSLDPNHLVTSGDAQVRPECTSRRETFPRFKFRSDTWREWLANNLASQPDPLDVFSFHFYGNATPDQANVPWKGMTVIEEMRQVVRCVHAAEAPVFIGELGASPNNRADPTGRWLCESIDAMEAENVSLMALWVWHFPWQPEFTMTSASYPDVVKRAAIFNREHNATAGARTP
jgi:mannan endo-1,4-beta-mannosidase